jgi:hypothetical protein
VSTTLPILPTDASFITSPETIIDSWSTPSARYRLVSRAGIFRLEIWDRYRWMTEAHGLQCVARRIADLTREHREHGESRKERGGTVSLLAADSVSTVIPITREKFRKESAG